MPFRVFLNYLLLLPLSKLNTWIKISNLKSSMEFVYSNDYYYKLISKNYESIIGCEPIWSKIKMAFSNKIKIKQGQKSFWLHSNEVKKIWLDSYSSSGNDMNGFHAVRAYQSVLISKVFSSSQSIFLYEFIILVWKDAKRR